VIIINCMTRLSKSLPNSMHITKLKKDQQNMHSINVQTFRSKLYKPCGCYDNSQLNFD